MWYIIIVLVHIIQLRRDKMIEIKNLSKSFNGKDYVLENLNCKIKDKAIYGLVGENGAGK